MCKSNLHDFLVHVPKVELHCHLEGTLSPALLLELASRNGVTIPDDPAFSTAESLSRRYSEFTSLDDFLHYYFVGMSCLVNERDFQDLAWRYFLKAHSDNVTHAELFFDPQAHTSRGVQLETVVAGFEKACQCASDQLHISTLLIPCFLRHLPLQSSETLWHDLEAYAREERIAGIGLSGSEKAFPPQQWATIYRNAKTMGIRRTAHAGEEGPVEFIRQAVEDLGVQRIDHGIRLAEDDSLLQEIASRQLLLTMCPLSNLKLRCVQRIEELPVRKYLDAGVRFCVNSDDPAYFGGYILDNFCAVQEAFNLDLEHWLSMSRAAIEGSWCTEAQKSAMKQALEEAALPFQTN